MKLRLDLLLVEKGLFPDQDQAQRMIRAGRIYVDEQPADKPGRQYPISAKIRLKEVSRYVSRGGEKLQGALEYFQPDLLGKLALDIGSSTGGFTDCLLQAGVRKVYCIDVGKGQLAWKLRQDPRVVVQEGVNARYLSIDDIPEAPDIITIDVSFISLKKVIPAGIKLLQPEGEILALIKPQFEAGRDEVERGGVVRDPRIHERVIEEIVDFSSSRGLKVVGVKKSVLTGPAGNKEFFIFLGKIKML
ncbi:MAG: TlyA family RNA methyltransferase [Candidatus Auribacterota bacterium]|nr:TlyA family RNA methyltransferase [Candidatus Auribacterota bacterium]